jgi:Glycosyltransferase family 87
MTAALPTQTRWQRFSGWAVHSPSVIWAAFVLAHLWLGWVNLNAPGLPLGDVTIWYRYWAEEADLNTYYVGVDTTWVYPIVALIPMVIAGVFGFGNYSGTWLSLVFVLDAVAFAAMVGWRRPGRPVVIGWWWIGFLLLLGPIAMGRIDSISVPLAIVGVLYIATRPRLAALVLAIATWIKVWPAAILAAAVIASRDRVRILIAAVASSAVIIAAVLGLGGARNVFSFITQQTGRGLQVEAPVSNIWMWMSFAHVPNAYPYYDQAINTYEVTGPFAAGVASIMTVVLAVVVVALAVLGIVAVRRGARVTELLPPLALAFVTAFIAFNKVGSPQYITWLAAPIILGLATNATGHGRSFRTPAIISLVIAALTQAFYPYFYLQLLELHLTELLALSARNILLFVVLGWAVAVVWDVSRRWAVHEKLVDSESWLPSVWPFGTGAPESVSADDTE